MNTHVCSLVDEDTVLQAAPLNSLPALVIQPGEGDLSHVVIWNGELRHRKLDLSVATRMQASKKEKLVV